MKQLNALHNDVNFDVNNLTSILDVMQVPADGSADTELQLFSTALYQLDKNLDRFHQRPCAVCHQNGHTFQQCPLLQNASRVRDVYGKLVAYLNRFQGVATKLNKSLQEFRSTPVQELQVFSLAPAPSFPSGSSVTPSLVSSVLAGVTTPTAIHNLHPTDSSEVSWGASVLPSASPNFEADDTESDTDESLDFT